MGIKKNGDFNFSKKFKNISKLKKSTSTKLGNLAKNHFIMGFRKGGFQTDESITGWKRRIYNTDRGRAILVKTGSLRRSIKILQSNNNRIIIGTRGLRYSRIHNEGGTIPITTKMRKFFYAKYYESNKKVSKNAMFWIRMAKHKGNTIRMPKREYIGKSKELERKIYDMLKNELNEYFKTT